MIIYVWKFNGSWFEKTSVIDNATSVIWTKRFQETGDFELYIPASAELFELFSGETIVTRDDDNSIMWVEEFQLNTDIENGDYVTVSGRSAECILERRMVARQTTLNSTAEYGIRKLINDNMISPAETRRKIEFVKLGNNHSWNDRIQKQITGTNLLKAVEDICITYNYGYKITMNDQNEFVFDLYKGVDRSYNQTINPYVVFSPEFENIGNTEYNLNNRNVFNHFYVAGEGEGTDRRIREYSPKQESGLNMREMWIDARDVSSNNGEITDDEYNALLDARGKQQYEENRPVVSFGGEIINTNGYVYGVDYDLGDVVSVMNEYGIRGNATVTEIIEVEDESGYKIVPTLSEWSV